MLGQVSKKNKGTRIKGKASARETDSLRMRLMIANATSLWNVLQDTILAYEIGVDKPSFAAMLGIEEVELNSFDASTACAAVV